MLKAVRFDLEEHAALIEFVENFRDRKNKPNHSEAIRLLMSKGLEALNQPAESPQPAIDIESLKSDIFNQLMAQINTMNMTPPPQQRTEPPKTITPGPKELHGRKPPPSSPRPPRPPSQSVPKSAAVNPLLANLLGNADR